MANTKILVVEDETIIADDIKGILEDIGYTISGLASTGEEALEKAEETRPDLVLMDIVLKKGKMDGIEAAGRYIHVSTSLLYIS